MDNINKNPICRAGVREDFCLVVIVFVWGDEKVLEVGGDGRRIL